MIRSWMISWSVFYELCRKDLPIKYSDDGFVKEMRESVGSCLVLDDQPGGNLDQVWV